jgi:hypothetical protein
VKELSDFINTVGGVLAREARHGYICFICLLVSFRFSCCVSDSVLAGKDASFFSFMLVGCFHFYGFPAE